MVKGDLSIGGPEVIEMNKATFDTVISTYPQRGIAPGYVVQKEGKKTPVQKKIRDEETTHIVDVRQGLGKSKRDANLKGDRNIVRITSTLTPGMSGGPCFLINEQFNMLFVGIDNSMDYTRNHNRIKRITPELLAHIQADLSDGDKAFLATLRKSIPQSVPKPLPLASGADALRNARKKPAADS